MTARRLSALGLWAAGLSLGVDQLSKSWAHAWVGAHGPQPVFPGLTIIATSNTGMAFSLGEGAALWVLIGIALAICGWFFWWLLRAEGPAEASGLGLAIGGALGNVVDRLRFGAVRDFVDAYWGNWHWPAFNLADAAILTGLAMVVLFHKERGDQSKPPIPDAAPVERRIR